jgi:hypothetical protein
MSWKSWKYKNLTILVCTLVISFFIGSNSFFKDFMFNHGLPTAFLAGGIFISTFTCPIACAMLLVLAEKFPLQELWIIAAAGAVISDFVFFNLVKDQLGEEIAPIIEDVADVKHFDSVLDTEHFKWIIPIIGAGLILSPLPNVIGLKMIGVRRLKKMHFVALSAAVNTIGIAFILLLSFVIKP